MGAVVLPDSHRQLERLARERVDRAGRYGADANDRLQRAADEYRYDLLPQRQATSRYCGATAALRDHSFVPEMTCTVYTDSDRTVTGDPITCRFHHPAPKQYQAKSRRRLFPIWSGSL